MWSKQVIGEHGTKMAAQNLSMRLTYDIPNSLFMFNHRAYVFIRDPSSMVTPTAIIELTYSSVIPVAW